MSDHDSVEILRGELEASLQREAALKHLNSKITEFLNGSKTNTNLEQAISELVRVEQFYEGHISSIKQVYAKQVSELKAFNQSLAEENESLKEELKKFKFSSEEEIKNLRERICELLSEEKKPEAVPEVNQSDLSKLRLQKNQALAKAEYYKAEFHKCKENFDHLLENYTILKKNNSIEEDVKFTFYGSEISSPLLSGINTDRTCSTVLSPDQNELAKKIESLENYVADLLDKLARFDEDRKNARNNEKKYLMELKKKEFEVNLQAQEVKKLEKKLDRIQHVVEFGENLENIQMYLQQIIADKISFER